MRAGLGGAVGLLAALALAVPTVAAGGEEPTELVECGMAAQVPSDWKVRARWREDTLVAFLTPGMVQEALDLCHDPRRQEELVTRLCLPADDPAWRLVGPGRDVAVEPEVMGKGSSRLGCRATAGLAPAP